ncbi:hypothetical protein PUR61_03735 [Streptomyces sp. BE20]|nr:MULTISPECIES: hypothetical protein [unclassified Streptomyces]MED7948823.1 hypothetical protein [Streptomyces sp. BE303]MEE1821312.1 hypothetical protein [Streptomyces sp. BE20]
MGTATTDLTGSCGAVLDHTGATDAPAIVRRGPPGHRLRTS